MSTIIQELDSEGVNAQPMPRFRPGDTVRVHVRIKEGAKERIQVFEGVVIASHVAGVASTLTVRILSVPSKGGLAHPRRRHPDRSDRRKAVVDSSGTPREACARPIQYRLTPS